MAKKREIVFLCSVCDSELDVQFHEGSDGEVVFVIEPCVQCLNSEFAKGFEDGYAECDEKYYLRRLHLRLQKE